MEPVLARLFWERCGKQKETVTGFHMGLVFASHLTTDLLWHSLYRAYRRFRRGIRKC